MTGFRVCFYHRAHENDPTAIPVSCQRIEHQVAAAEIPASVKAAVASAVSERAVPLARKDDFTRSLQQTLLLWQVASFVLGGLLVFAVPKVAPSSTVPAVAG